MHMFWNLPGRVMGDNFCLITLIHMMMMIKGLLGTEDDRSLVMLKNKMYLPMVTVVTKRLLYRPLLAQDEDVEGAMVNRDSQQYQKGILSMHQTGVDNTLIGPSYLCDNTIFSNVY